MWAEIGVCLVIREPDPIPMKCASRGESDPRRLAKTELLKPVTGFDSRVRVGLYCIHRLTRPKMLWFAILGFRSGDVVPLLLRLYLADLAVGDVC